MDILKLIGRTESLFDKDLAANRTVLDALVSTSSFLVLGGAGSIGQSVCKEIMKRKPVKLYVVDINENNLAELVRDVRSSLDGKGTDFRTFTLDIGSLEFDAFMLATEGFDYVLNLSALKHVRSERDPFTLMRMVVVNILNTEKTLNLAREKGAVKYFGVSTDKAANPVNMMGASKRIMEMFMMRASADIPVTSARFANVAFSDGSLLAGFEQRIKKRQPIVAPTDVLRYFITPQESGELCLMSCLLGDTRDIFFPKHEDKLEELTFSSIAANYLGLQGYKVYECEDEDEARALSMTLPAKGIWPCLFSKSDTTGEKAYEEFYTGSEVLNLDRFDGIGIIKSELGFSQAGLDSFLSQLNTLRNKGEWTKADILALFVDLIPDFQHLETGKHLDAKM